MQINNQSIAHKLKYYLPKEPQRTYKPVGICIYCGNALSRQTLYLTHIKICTYGTNPGAGTSRLVIPVFSLQLF